MTTQTNKETTQVAKKPTMAGKGEFSLPDFEAVDDVPVLASPRATTRLPMGFDEMLETLKKTKKAAIKREIPAEFWEARGIAKDKIVPAANKDRIRRSLYSWQGTDKEKLSYTVAFSDQYDAKQKYTGVVMYFQKKPS